MVPNKNLIYWNKFKILVYLTVSYFSTHPTNNFDSITLFSQCWKDKYEILTKKKKRKEKENQFWITILIVV